MRTAPFIAKMIPLSCAMLLTACAATNDVSVGDPIDSMRGKHAATERRLATAALDAIAEGKTNEALINYEKLYNRSPSNAEIAVNYAQLLRKSGQTEQALKVLQPFAIGQKKDMPSKAPLAMIQSEYAAALIANGQFEPAQKMLDGILTNPDAAEFHPDASHLAGVALDAQGHHKAAEKLLRQALDGWKGDPTSVMNNLALNLASQGMFDESLTTLRKAQIMAPEKTEIARNIQIVSDLRQAIVPKAPVDIKK
jgi:Flp pilus assembly protein TadD